MTTHIFKPGDKVRPNRPSYMELEDKIYTVEGVAGGMWVYLKEVETPGWSKKYYNLVPKQSGLCKFLEEHS